MLFLKLIEEFYVYAEFLCVCGRQECRTHNGILWRPEIALEHQTVKRNLSESIGK